MHLSLGYVIFYVPDVAAAVDFYRTAFGLSVRMQTPEGDYGELETGATVLAFVAESLAEDNLGAAGGYTRHRSDGPPSGSTPVMVTDDVEGAVEAAVAAGARRYVEPTVKPWGQTVAYVIDASGILVELATPVAAG
ncbi:MAG: VOC family protein [Actinomycetota bacterium]